MFHRFGHVIHIEGDLALAEFWGVKRLQVVVVERRVLLWQTKRFVGLAVLVYVAEVRLTI